jgi:alpha-L-arabinofuranosidase
MRLGSPPLKFPFLLPGLVAVWLLGSSLPVLAQASLPVYTDNLVNSFQDYSWIPDNLANTTPVHSGEHSIKADANDDDWEALAFVATVYDTYQGGFNSTLYDNLVFWADGGATGGQLLDVVAVGGANQDWGPGYYLSALPTNSWQQFTIPLSSLLPAGATNMLAIIIELTPNGATNTFYVDDISITAQPAPSLEHLSVDASQTIRTADLRWFGVNTAIWDSYLDTAATSNALRQAGVLSLRFPAGSESDEYNWENGVSTVWSDGKVTSTFTSSSTWANFMHVATNGGAQAFITVNYGSGTSNLAAAWVRSANLTNHCNFKYWEVGNEVYGSWEQDTNNPPNDPFIYATRFAGYQALMKAADPNIEVGAVSVPGEDSYNTYSDHPATNSVTGDVHNGWTPVMLATLQSLGVTPDFLIYHLYPEYTPVETPAPVDDSDPLVLQVSSQVAGDAANLRMMINDYFGDGGNNIELCCTENNSDSGAEGRQMTSLVNALYLADTACQFMKTEINSYTWWDLRNGAGTTGSFDPTFYGWRTEGDEGLIDGSSSYYPDYYAMQMLQYLARPGDTVLNAESDYLLLSSYAVRHVDGSLSLLVINKDTEAAFTAQLSLTNFVPASLASVHFYGMPQDNAAKNNESIALQSIAVSNYTTAAALFTNSFPPLSLTLFTFSPAAPMLQALPAPAGQFAVQLNGQAGTPYIVQTSTNLVNWTSVSTNIQTGSSLGLTNAITPGAVSTYWRVVWQP